MSNILTMRGWIGQPESQKPSPADTILKGIDYYNQKVAQDRQFAENKRMNNANILNFRNAARAEELKRKTFNLAIDQSNKLTEIEIRQYNEKMVDDYVKSLDKNLSREEVMAKTEEFFKNNKLNFTPTQTVPDEDFNKMASEYLRIYGE